MFAYRQAARDRATDEQADQPIAAASRVQSARGETVVSRTAAAQALIGLRTAALRS